MEPQRDLQRSSWVHKAARAGFATKGVLYLILGGLTLSAIFGRGHSIPQNQQSVMREIGEQPQPFGEGLLVLTAAGLFAYAVFRFLQAAVDIDNKGKSKKALIKRVGYAVSGLLHAGLGVTALQLLGNARPGSTKTTVAKVLAEPAGSWLVGIGGAFIIVFGMVQLKKAVTLSFERDLKTYKMTAEERSVVRALGRAGLAARGIVFPIIGYFLIEAALASDASKAKNIGGAMAQLTRGGGGIGLLAVVAAGLAAFGIFQLAVAKYRRIPAE